MKIIFDLDGTLIDVSARHHAVYKQITEDIGGDALEKDRYWQLKRERTPWLEIFKLSKVPQERGEEFMERFISLIEQPGMLSLDTVLPGAKELLESLRGGHRLFLVSLRRSDENLVNELKDLGLYDFFDKVVSGHTDAETHDLKADVIRELLEGDSDGVIVGDTEADVKAAQELGLTSVAVLSGIRGEAYLRNLKPDFVINDVRELVTSGCLERIAA